MHTFASKPKATQQVTSAKSEISSPAHFEQSGEVDAMPPIVQERAQTSRGVLETAPRFPGSQPTGTSWDFSRIPLYASSAPAKHLPGPIQRKLKVGAIDDPLEHEADRVADQVMRMPASDALMISSRPQVSRKCDECEEEEKLQKKETGPQTVAGEAPASVHETLRSAGQPLDIESHAFFAPRFGRDLSQVRIHADSRAAESAHSVYARAYTVGHHVVFGRDQYAPHTADGRYLLAHELTHTLQQQGCTAAESRPHAAPGDRLVVRRQTGPKPPIPTGANFTTEEVALLRQARATLQPKGNAIVGVLIPQGGKPILLQSGGGQGFSSHIEGKATIVMREQGITRAKLIIELEPCQICDRSTYTGPDVPSGGVTGSASGKQIPLQTSKINTALPAGTKLTVVGPDSTGVYEGVGPKTSSKAPFVPPVSDPHPDPVPAQTTAPPKATAPTPTPKAPPSGPAAGDPPQLKGPGGKSGTVTDAKPQGAVSAGGTTPAPKTTGPAPQAGLSSQVAIHIGTGVASLGLAWLAAYLKARVDQKIAQRQIDAFLEVAKKRINANPDEALKKMMIAPEVTVYAWVYLDSAVITTFGVDSASPEPITSDSSPIIDLSRIDYAFAPVDRSLIESFPRISGGGRHITTVRTIVIDIPLQTPSVEEMLAYAKGRNLPLVGLLDYALYRFRRSTADYEIAMIDKHDLQKVSTEMHYWQNVVDLITKAIPPP